MLSPEERQAATPGFEVDLKQPVVCVVGPTASGKTDVAQEVAARIGGAVVSADSMQIYRSMDIGTGKIAPAQRRVEHFGLDICEPGEPYSAALFQDYARSCFRALDAQGRRSVLAGGTGLYGAPRSTITVSRAASRRAIPCATIIPACSRNREPRSCGTCSSAATPRARR